MGGERVFWIDDRYDREHAGDDPAGRYAGRLRAGIGAFDGCWGDIAPVAFACAAWRLATPPALDPGFVRAHRRVLAAECVRNGWDGSLIARVDLVSELPAELTASRVWWRDRGWQGWPNVFGQYVEPAERDLAKVPYARPILRVDAPVPLDGLPPAPDGPDADLAATARRAVSVLAAELSALVAPVIARLEGGEG